MSALVIQLARAWCIAGHTAAGQYRKFTGEDYSSHPIRVSQIIEEMYPDDHNMIAAAAMHDLVEDTGITLGLIREHFGDDVAYLVQGCTKVSKPEDGNREVRSAKDIEHINKGTLRVKTIKAADAADNMSGLRNSDPIFAKLQVKEKRDLLKVLTGVDPHLLKRLEDALDDAAHHHGLHMLRV